MRNILLTCLLYLLLVATLPSCVRDVTMDAREKPQVVVACILTDKAEQTLQLSFTKGASLSEAPALTEASVVLLDDDGLVGHFERKQGSEWKLAYKAIPGKHYRLEVTVPGYDLITAEQTMPEPAKVYSVSWYYYADKIEGLNWPSLDDQYLNFLPNADDFDSLPLGTKSFYIHDIPNPIWIYAMDYDPETGGHRLVDEICTECPLVDSFNTTGEKYVPPQRTDIPNPYVEGSHIAQLAPQLAGVSLHRHYLRFPAADLLNGWWFTVSGSMQGKYNCKDFYRSFYWKYYGDMGLVSSLLPDEGYLEITAVSKELDQLLCDAHYRHQLQESSDLSTIYLRDNSFTNIHGGLGIFGARCSRKYQWSGEYDYVDDGYTHHYYSGAAVPRENFDSAIIYDGDWSFLDKYYE